VKLVLDASAALAIAAEKADSGLWALLDDAEEVLAPDLFVAEATNGVWKYHEFSGISPATADERLEIAIGFVDTWIPCRDLYREALALASVARRPSYDMFYLALARREGAQLLTLDKALRKEASKRGIATV